VSVATLLNMTCTLERKSVTTASTGAKSVTWTTVSSSLPCAVQGSSTREQRNADRQDGVLTFTAYFAHGTDIRPEDRITPASGTASGLKLYVDGPAIDDAGRGAYVRVPLVYQRGGGVP
jgi:hypothetical protein